MSLRVLQITFLILICACGSRYEPESALPTVSQGIKAEQDVAAPVNESAEISGIDSILYLFTQTYLKPGKHLVEVKYPYRPERDTLVYNQQDSVLIYLYSNDSISAYYQRSTPWINSTRSTWADDSVLWALDQFQHALNRALSCQGIIYDYGDQYLESFLFESEEASQKACHYFEKSENFIFPKTLSFAVAFKKRLYVFHARYMGPSWNSKKEFQLFKSFLYPDIAQ